VRVLLVGSGAREHALAWSFSRSPALDRLLILPGNPGMEPLGDTVDGVSPTDVGAVAMMAASQRIDLAVIGPEAPLAAGVSDALNRAGVPTFGPTRAAARLESSKAFAKDVMTRAQVPTAAASVFTDPSAAHGSLDSSDGPYVVKADGLAAGKGVLVTDKRSEAHAWVDRCFEGGFGDAGATVVIEDYLDGPELSVFAISDGTRHLTLQPARDYKRLRDHDEGPNTGGMGSFSPVDLPSDLVPTVDRTVITPVLDVMRDDGRPYVGFLYVGLALTAEGPKVIEFNCRLGDPETQVLLPRMSNDMLPILEAAAHGDVGTHPSRAGTPAPAVNVVLAAAGYPEAPRTGDPITARRGRARRHVARSSTPAPADEGAPGRAPAGGRVLSVVGRGPRPRRRPPSRAYDRRRDAIAFKPACSTARDIARELTTLTLRRWDRRRSPLDAAPRCVPQPLPRRQRPRSCARPAHAPTRDPGPGPPPRTRPGRVARSSARSALRSTLPTSSSPSRNGST
jgi:phosphoribosylamine---glycine ligase